MALMVLLVLGIAIFHILAISNASPNTANNNQIISNILSMFGGLLSAIIGFYFGGKAAEKKEEQKQSGSNEHPTA